jgi:hypothetical protein
MRDDSTGDDGSLLGTAGTLLVVGVLAVATVSGGVAGVATDAGSDRTAHMTGGSLADRSDTNATAPAGDDGGSDRENATGSEPTTVSGTGANDTDAGEGEPDAEANGTVATATATPEPSGPPRVTGKAELYVPGRGLLGSNSETLSVIEISFDRPVVDARSGEPLNESTVRVRVNGRYVSDRYTVDDDASAGSGSTTPGQLVLSSPMELEVDDNVRVRLPPLAAADGEGTTDGPLVVSVPTTSGTAAESTADGSPKTAEFGVYAGSPVAVLANDGEGDVDNPIVVRSRSRGYVDEHSTGTASQVWLFDTRERNESDNYWFDMTGDEGTARDDNQPGVRFSRLNLSVRVDETQLDPGESIRGIARADDVGRQVRVILEDPAGNEESTVVRINGSNEAGFSFGPLYTTGSYSVTVNDTLSNRSVRTRYVAVQPGVASLRTTEFEDQRGDVVEIPVEVSRTDSAVVVVGSEEVGYRAVVEVNDGNRDGKVVLRWNTFLADGPTDGTGEAFSVRDDSNYYGEDSLTVRSVNASLAGGDGSPPELLDAGSYPIDAYGGSSTAGLTDAVATVLLRERTLRDVDVLAAPDRLAGDLEDLAAVEAAKRSGNLSRTSTVAMGDLLVLQVGATGLEGGFAAYGDVDDAERFVPFSANGSLEIVEVDPGTNREPARLEITQPAVEVVPDGDRDTYYLLVDTGDVGVDPLTAASGAADLEPGDTVEANVTVNWTASDRGAGADSVGETFTYDERTFDVPDPVNVTASGTVSLRVPTTLAPGTEVRLRIRAESNPGAAFLRTQTVRVNREGTVVADLDGRGFQIGTEFTVRLTARDVETTVDGRVVEPGATPTPEPTPAATPTPEPTPAATPTPAPTSTPSAAASTPTPAASTPTPAAGQSDATSTPAAAATPTPAGTAATPTPPSTESGGEPVGTDGEVSAANTAASQSGPSTAGSDDSSPTNGRSPLVPLTALVLLALVAVSMPRDEE